MTIKVYKPEIAAIVGIPAASLLSHIKYWCETKQVEKIYRTNKQMAKDFGGSMSESQIQRAKKKLLDSGFVVITHDLGHTRTTHYSLTEKAKTMLGMAVQAVKKVKKYVKTKFKSMADNFKEEGKRSGRHEIPEDIRLKLAGLIKKKPEPEVVEEQLDYDEHFKALDIAMESCLSKQNEPVAFGNGVSSGVFSRIPNIDLLEKKRKMLDDAKYFNEDF